MKQAKIVLRLTKKQFDSLIDRLWTDEKLRKEILKQTEKQRAHEIKIAENRKRLRNKRRALARRREAKSSHT